MFSGVDCREITVVFCYNRCITQLKFSLSQMSWKTANKKQREKLLELIRRLAEDDKDGVMAHKVS